MDKITTTTKDLLETVNTKAEQLDELSKKTLGSYINKATTDAIGATVDFGAKQAAKDEIDRFTNRHMKDKFKANDAIKAMMGADNKSIETTRERIGKRIKGISTATNKLTKENTDLEESHKIGDTVRFTPSKADGSRGTGTIGGRIINIGKDGTHYIQSNNTDNVHQISSKQIITNYRLRAMKEEVDMQEAADEENFHTDETFSRRQTPAEKAAGQKRAAGHAHVAKLKQVTRVNKGTYGRAVIDDEDEHPAGAPEKTPKHVASPELLKAFGLGVRQTVSQKAVKTVSHGITTKQQTKGSDARKELQAKLRAAKTAAEKAKLRAQYRNQLGEETEAEKWLKARKEYQNSKTKEEQQKDWAEDKKAAKKARQYQFGDNAKLNESSFKGTPKVTTDKYSWGTMKTVHHGIDFSIPLHPEMHQAIAKLNDGESHSFKDETKTNWTATRNGDTVNFKSKQGYKTAVPHSSLKEETEQLDELSLTTLLAVKDRGQHFEKIGKNNPNGVGKAYEKMGKKLQKKVTDKIAKGRFTKEEAELEEMAMGSKKNSKGKKVEWHNIGGQHMIHYDGKPAHKGFLSHEKAAKLYGALSEEISIDVIKNGLYEYTVEYNGSVVKFGKAPTEIGAYCQAVQFIDSIVEEAQSQIDTEERAKEIIKEYTKG